jgi:hypothetical protein
MSRYISFLLYFSFLIQLFDLNFNVCFQQNIDADLGRVIAKVSSQVKTDNSTKDLEKKKEKKKDKKQSRRGLDVTERQCHPRRSCGSFQCGGAKGKKEKEEIEEGSLQLYHHRSR